MEAAVSQMIPLQKEDIFLICSDGLTELVMDERIQEILASGKNSSEISSTLVMEALNNGGTDNITVMVIKIEEL